MRSLWIILKTRSLWRVLIEEVVMEDFLGKLKTTKYVLFRECRGEGGGGSIKIWKILCFVIFTALRIHIETKGVKTSLSIWFQ